jgi:H+/gluconate symporter-like permease
VAVVGLTAGVLGSSAAGLLLALTAHGEAILAAGQLDAPRLHRLAALASGVLDTLPHSGAVLALLTICRTTHAASYGDVFVVTVLGPALALAAVAVVFGV